MWQRRNATTNPNHQQVGSGDGGGIPLVLERRSMDWLLAPKHGGRQPLVKPLDTRAAVAPRPLPQQRQNAQATLALAPQLMPRRPHNVPMVDLQSKRNGPRRARVRYDVFNMYSMARALPSVDGDDRREEAAVEEEEEGEEGEEEEIERHNPFDVTRLLHAPVMRHFDQQLARYEESYGNAFFERGDPPDEATQSNKRVTGDQIVQQVQKQLDSFGLVREEHQRKFHDMFIESCLPKIYEREWSNNYERIMRRFGLEKLKQESLIVCPRRYGKTYSVGMFCAAYLMNVPNCEIALFSTGKRTAGKLMALILSFLDMIPGFRDKIETKNQELLVLNFGVGDKRKLNCYPGSVAHGHCIHCGVPLDAYASTAQEVTLLDPDQAAVALQATACSDACAALVASDLQIGAIFLFDVTIAKLEAFGNLEGRTQNIVARVLESFQAQPLEDSKTTTMVNRAKLHAEFFSPNTRVRTKDVNLPLKFNLRARGILNRADPVYVRQFALDPTARKRVVLTDFFNRKSKPRFVRLTGIPSADPNVKYRLRETFRMVLGEQSQAQARSLAPQLYVAKMVLPKKGRGGGRDRDGFLALVFDERDQLTALYAISAPKSEQGTRRRQPETFGRLTPEQQQQQQEEEEEEERMAGDDESQTARRRGPAAPSDKPPPPPPPPPVRDNINSDWFDDYADDYCEDADNLDLEEQEEEEEEEEQMLMVNDRILFKARERVRPLFTWQQVQDGSDLTRNARTKHSFANDTLLRQLVVLEDNEKMRDGLLALMANDIDMLEMGGMARLKKFWQTNPVARTMVRTSDRTVLKVELYALPGSKHAGNVAQRRIETRRLTDNNLTMATFADVETNVVADMPLGSGDPSLSSTSDWRETIYSGQSVRTSGRRIVLFGGGSGSSDLFLEDFYRWPKRGTTDLPSVESARTVGLTLKDGRNQLFNIYLRANAGYREAKQTLPLARHDKLVVLVANIGLGKTRVLDPEIANQLFVALVFEQSKFREHTAVEEQRKGKARKGMAITSMERYRYRLKYLLHYDVRPGNFQ